MTPGLPLVPALAGLVAVALVGRVALSLLPAGPLGSHLPRDLPVTWAASHLLGAVLLGLEATLFPGLAAAERAPLLVLPWALPLTARLATLPGALVPGHGTHERSVGVVARSLGFALSMGILAAPLGILLGTDPGVAWRPRESALEAPGLLAGGEGILAALSSAGTGGAWRVFVAATWSALLVLFVHALAQARRMRSGRRFAGILLAASGLPLGLALAAHPALPAACLAGAGACQAVAWVRRADRRALVLATLFLAGMATAGEPAAAGLGLALLALVSPGPSRRLAVTLGAIAAALFVGTALLLGEKSAAPWPPVDAGLGAWLDPRRAGLVGWGALLALGWSVVRRVRAKAPPLTDPRVAVDPPRTELVLCAAMLAGLVLLSLAGALDAPAGLLGLPVAALFAGLALLPPTRLP